jgi:hypothetical protein
VQVVQPSTMGTRERQPAIRLSGVDVLQKEYLGAGILFLGFLAEAALTRRHRFGLLRVARTFGRAECSGAEEQHRDDDSDGAHSSTFSYDRLA